MSSAATAARNRAVAALSRSGTVCVLRKPGRSFTRTRVSDQRTTRCETGIDPHALTRLPILHTSADEGELLRLEQRPQDIFVRLLGIAAALGDDRAGL